MVLSPVRCSRGQERRRSKEGGGVGESSLNLASRLSLTQSWVEVNVGNGSRIYYMCVDYTRASLNSRKMTEE